MNSDIMHCFSVFMGMHTCHISMCVRCTCVLTHMVDLARLGHDLVHRHVPIWQHLPNVLLHVERLYGHTVQNHVGCVVSS